MDGWVYIYSTVTWGHHEYLVCEAASWCHNSNTEVKAATDTPNLSHHLEMCKGG